MVGVIILAAGRGKRMGGKASSPKVLYPLRGRPIMSYLLESIEKSELQTRPTLVIAPDLQIIRTTFGEERYRYAIQEKQLGTGHAVLSAKDTMKEYDDILVLCGDHPFITTSDINALMNKHQTEHSVLALATARLPDFSEWRAGFRNFGRIVRDDAGSIVRIVEVKDASEDELHIKEVNPNYMCFNASWLWKHLPLLHANNAQGEYYLTDLVGMAIRERKRVASIELENHREAFGINTPEQLALAEQLLSHP